MGPTAGVSGGWRGRRRPGGFAARTIARTVIAGVCWLTVGWATQALPAEASSLEKPELSVELVSGSSATLLGVLSPGAPDEAGSQYEFVYRPGSECQGPGQVTLPASPGVSAGAQNEQLAGQQLTGLAANIRYTACLALTNTNGSETVLSAPVGFVTQATGTFALPDGRMWELVSPPNKHGALLDPLTENGGVIQASADGSKFTYVAVAPATEQPAGSRSFQNTQLFSTRTSTGWTTQDISTPHEEIEVLPAGNPSEYKFFSENLSAGIVEPLGATPLSTLASERTPYRAEPGAGACPARPPIVPASICYEPLVTTANVPEGTKFGGVEEKRLPGNFSEGVIFVTATPDLSHVVLSSRQVLTEGFTSGFSSKKGNLYELSGGVLRLVSVLPANGEEAERPAAEAGLTAVVGNGGSSGMRGAISSDGNRIIFSTRGTVGGGHLYLRDMALGQTVQLDVPQPGAPGGPGMAEFQAASSDGTSTRVFFTTHEDQLTTDPPAQTEGRDLYMCEVVVVAGRLSCVLSDLSVDVNPGEQAEVAGESGEVSAVDVSGRFVYFVASGVLTSEANARGETAPPCLCKRTLPPGEVTASEEEEPCNMYVYDTVSRRIHLVAVLTRADQPDWGFGPLTSIGSLTVRSSPDGRYFAFMSDRPLTGYDNVDVNEALTPQQEREGVGPGVRVKHRDEEVFLYDSQTEGLSCVSCNPSGGRPHGVFDKSEKQTPPTLVDNPRGWPERWLAGSIPGWTLIGSAGSEAALRQPRYLFDSGRVFFDGADGLVARDANGVEDVYEFEPVGVGGCTEDTSSGGSVYASSEGGCVGLVSSGASSEESAFLEASEGDGEGESGEAGREGGNDVFFLTAARLSLLDVDSALDVYDAHVCGSSCPVPLSSPPVCEGDACQGVVAPPSELTPGSLTFSGPGNQAAFVPVAPKPKTAAQIRAEKLAKALKVCRRDRSRKRRVVCEAVARRRFGPAHKAGAMKAVRARRGSRS